MDDFYELIAAMVEAKKECGFQFSITPRSNVASGPIEFALNLEMSTGVPATYDMVNCREAIGFIEGFTAHYEIIGIK